MTRLAAAIVIPCYNESSRIDANGLERFLSANRHIAVVLVNDGSSDATIQVLRRIEGKLPGQVNVIDLHHNQGKAEAVRHGLLHATSIAPIAGFWDADFATPLEVIPEFLAILESRPDIHWVFGSRVKLLGRDIERKESRHYLGRIFATGASMVLGLGVYDTQCGAKMFRVSPLFRALIEAPFLTRWVFDVELIARLTAAARRQEASAPSAMIFEAPLKSWRDVAGSKVKISDFFRSGFELVVIWWKYLRD